ncbi:MAG: hypothetical protein IT433_05235 [Phycisphaerales bacterium]|nr:hypothetical protein [Phycisphaerales bacterium]
MKSLIHAGLLLLALSSSAANAQPEDFIDLGRRVAQETIVVPIHLDFAEDVQWVRIELPTLTAEAGFVDIWTRVEEWTPLALLWPRAACYDNSGRVIRGLHSGSFNQVVGSFGQVSPRRPPNVLDDEVVDCLTPFQGQLAGLNEGVYWFAIANGVVGFNDDWDVRAYVGPTLQRQRDTTLYIRVHPPEIPFCDPDLNWDGNADQDDVAYLFDLITNPSPIDPTNVCGADPDYNRDGTADMDDVRTLIDVIASGECPE